MPLVSGIYTGLTYTYKALSDALIQEVDAFLQGLVEHKNQDSVVSIYMVPELIAPSANTPTVPSVASHGVAKWASLDGYTPKNKKLLTYPYTFLTVDCGNDSKNFRMELFSGNTMSFRIWGTIAGDPKIACAPYDYNGVSNDYNPTEMLVMSGFPQCAFQIDSYRAWIAQHAVSDILGAASTAIGGVAQAQGGNYGAAVGAGLNVAAQINDMYIEATKGNTARGAQGGDVAVANRKKMFYFRQMGITAENARCIDDFFSRFGYAINRIKIPGTHNRPHWTYTKTRDCTINGSIPAPDKAKICSIFNHGITWWRNGSEVGRYDLDNTMIT